MNIMRRLIAASLLLVVAVCACLSIVRQAFSFDGQICLEPGIPASIVVRTHNDTWNWPGKTIGGVQTAAAPAEIPLESEKSAQLLSSSTAYDYVQTPVTLTLKSSLKQGEDIRSFALRLRSPGGEMQTHPIQKDDTLNMPDGALTVRDMRVWSGALPDASGTPMAEVRFEIAGDTTRLFLANNAVTRAGTDRAVLFDWCSSDAEAERKARTPLEAARLCRWGVVQGNATSWFTGLSQGAGADLPDGTSITLVSHDDAGRTLTVSVEKEGRRTLHTIRANEKVAGIPVCYEDTRDLPLLIHVCASRQDTAWVSVWRAGAEPAVQACGLEKPLPVDAEGLFFTLAAVCERGVIVPEKESPLNVAVCTFTPTGSATPQTRHIRQGVAVRMEDTLVELEVRVTPAEREYEIGASMGQTETVYRILTGANFTLGRWTFTVQPVRADLPELCILSAQRRF
jgi:hypothetical protein